MSATRLRPGYHVTVGPLAPNGTPHPHAGKTGTITRIKNSAAFVAVDRGIEPQGFIFVSLVCLHLDPSSQLQLFKTKFEWPNVKPFRPTLDGNVLRSYISSPYDVRDRNAFVEAKLAAKLAAARAKQSHPRSKFLKLKKVALFVIWYSSLVMLLNHPSLFTALWMILNTGVVILGAKLNRIAIVANGGRMPVRQSGTGSGYFLLHSTKHQYLTAEIKFQYLCDRYEMRRGKKIAMFSIGDVLIWAGYFGILTLAFFQTWQFFNLS